MKLDARTDNCRPWQLIDNATGKPITEAVIWADDQTGEHEVAVKDAAGRFVIEGDEFKTELRRAAHGRLQFRRVS